MKQAALFASGFVVLFALHLAVIGSARLWQAEQVSQDESMVLTLFIGAVQLLYAIPLAVLIRKRRAMLAGVGVAAALTVVINILGLRN